MVLIALLLTAPTIYSSLNLQNRTKWGAKTGDTVEELCQENMMMRDKAEESDDEEEDNH